MRGRVVGIGIAALAVGLAIGYLARGREEVAPGGAVASGERPDRAPGLAHGPEGGDAPASPVEPRAPDVAPAAPESTNDEQAVVVPVVEVSVVPSEGTPKDWGAIAYALPAGSHGVDRVEDVPHQSVSLDAPARIPILVPGLYDVVVRHAYATFVQRDVSVAHDDVTVRVALPPMAPIRLRVASKPPPLRANERYVASVRVESQLEKGVRWPGRDDPLRVESRIRLDLDGGETLAPEVPIGGTFELHPDLMLESDDPADPNVTYESVVLATELVPSQPLAHGGDVVSLAFRPGGTVRLAVKSDLSTWPDFPVQVGFGFERMSDGRWETENVPLRDRAAAEEWLRGGARFPLPAGTWSVEWFSDWLERGHVDGVEVRPNASTERSIDLKTRRRTEEPEPRLAIEVDANVPGPLGDVLWKSGRHDSFSRAHATVPPPNVLGDEAIVVVGREHASLPAIAPSDGVWRPAVVRAGALVVALDRVPEPAFGRVTVRRVDRFPIGVERTAGADEFLAEPEVAAGSVLGPFAPGTLRLEILVGGQRLRTVDVTVRAGRIETLRVSLPRTAAAR